MSHTVHSSTRVQNPYSAIYCTTVLCLYVVCLRDHEDLNWCYYVCTGFFGIATLNSYRNTQYCKAVYVSEPEDRSKPCLVQVDMF